MKQKIFFLLLFRENFVLCIFLFKKKFKKKLSKKSFNLTKLRKNKKKKNINFNIIILVSYFKLKIKKTKKNIIITKKK